MDQWEFDTNHRFQMLDITQKVQLFVDSHGVQDGIAVVYSPHTTAAVTINENWDPDVIHDFFSVMTRLIPKDFPSFRHGEGNSDSHTLLNLIGPSVSVIIDRGKIRLGQWQGIFFCELDGPRRRTVWVQTIGR